MSIHILYNYLAEIWFVLYHRAYRITYRFYYEEKDVSPWRTMGF